MSSGAKFYSKQSEDTQKKWSFPLRGTEDSDWEGFEMSIKLLRDVPVFYFWSETLQFSSHARTRTHTHRIQLFLTNSAAALKVTLFFFLLFPTLAQLRWEWDGDSQHKTEPTMSWPKRGEGGASERTEDLRVPINQKCASSTNYL